MRYVDNLHWPLVTQRWRARRVIAYSEDDIWVDPKDLEPPPKPRPKPEALRDLHKATTAEEIVDAMMADLDILGDGQAADFPSKGLFFFPLG